MNCLFMVVITLTTIGYGDWLELKTCTWPKASRCFGPGRDCGAGVFGVKRHRTGRRGLFTDVFRRRRMQKKIAALRDHIIICGVGSTGLHCVTSLCRPDARSSPSTTTKPSSVT